MDNKPRYIPRSFSETLELLCIARGEEFYRGGKINQSKVARVAGTSQPNVSRWLSGHFMPNYEQLKKLGDAFGINTSQMLGELPIERLDSVSSLTDRDRQFFEKYSKMPDKAKEYLIEAAITAEKFFDQDDQ